MHEKLIQQTIHPPAASWSCCAILAQQANNLLTVVPIAALLFVHHCFVTSQGPGAISVHQHVDPEAAAELPDVDHYNNYPLRRSA